MTNLFTLSCVAIAILVLLVVGLCWLIYRILKVQQKELRALHAAIALHQMRETSVRRACTLYRALEKPEHRAILASMETTLSSHATLEANADHDDDVTRHFPAFDAGYALGEQRATECLENMIREHLGVFRPTITQNGDFQTERATPAMRAQGGEA